MKRALADFQSRAGPKGHLNSSHATSFPPSTAIIHTATHILPHSFALNKKFVSFKYELKFTLCENKSLGVKLSESGGA